MLILLKLQTDYSCTLTLVVSYCDKEGFIPEFWKKYQQEGLQARIVNFKVMKILEQIERDMKIIVQVNRENFLTEAKPVLKSPASPKNGSDCRLLAPSGPASACWAVRKVKNPQDSRIFVKLSDGASPTSWSNNVSHFFLGLCWSWNVNFAGELQILLVKLHLFSFVLLSSWGKKTIQFQGKWIWCCVMWYYYVH